MAVHAVYHVASCRMKQCHLSAFCWLSGLAFSAHTRPLLAPCTPPSRPPCFTPLPLYITGTVEFDPELGVPVLLYTGRCVCVIVCVVLELGLEIVSWPVYSHSLI